MTISSTLIILLLKGSKYLTAFNDYFTNINQKKDSGYKIFKNRASSQITAVSGTRVRLLQGDDGVQRLDDSQLT